ncbi:MAG: hypothetical protein OER92_03160 [Alphaproteobacteria bacterium]|nr:hypothetical protein [Alphaproteobacteria bacterium]
MLSASQVLPHRILRTAVIALALIWPAHGALAAGDLDTLDKGPAVGTPIPHQLTAADQNNVIRDLSSLTGKNGLIVLFSRSFDW